MSWICWGNWLSCLKWKYCQNKNCVISLFLKEYMKEISRKVFKMVGLMSCCWKFFNSQFYTFFCYFSIVIIKLIDLKMFDLCCEYTWVLWNVLSSIVAKVCDLKSDDESKDTCFCLRSSRETSGVPPCDEKVVCWSLKCSQKQSKKCRKIKYVI